MARLVEYTETHNQVAKDYILNYEKHDHVVPSAVGMAVVMGIAKSTLYKWAKENRGELSNTLEQCKDYQHVTLLNKGLTSEFNSTITKLALANHGYSDKVEQTVSANVGLHELSEDELDRRIEENERAIELGSQD